MKPIRLAWLSLLRRKVPTAIALVAIAVSVACSGVLLRLYLLSGSRFSTLGRGGDAIVGAKAGGIEILLDALNGEGDYPGFLPYVLFRSMREEKTVKFEDGAEATPSYQRSIIPILFFGRYKTYRALGTDESFLSRPDREDSLVLAEGRWALGPFEIVLGADVARDENLHVGDTLPVTPWLGDETPASPDTTFRVTGILAPVGNVWDRTLYTNVRQAQIVVGSADLGRRSIWGADVLSYFFVYLKPGGMPALEALVNQRTVGQVISIPKEIRKLEELTGSGRNLGLLMTALIILLGALTVTAMLAARFEGMAIQLAVLRAIGYRKGEIGAWLLWEGLLLGAAACVLGALIDAAAFPELRSLLGSALPPPGIVPSPLYLSAPVWIATILGTTLAVLIPWLRLRNQDVHAALKGQ